MNKQRHHPQLSALHATQTPRALSAAARVFAWLFLLVPLCLLVAPWQQNIMGLGRVSAFVPMERQQNIDAPVGGRLVRWHVQEGSRVRSGDVLLEIADVDPDLLERVQQQRDAAFVKLRAKEDELQSYQLQKTNLEATRDLQVATAEQRLESARQRVRSAGEALAAARATHDAAIIQMNRLQRLLGEGLVSQRDYELARRDETVARRSVNSAQAALDSALAEQRGTLAEVDRIRADAQARIDSATASLNKTRSELEDSRASLAKAEVDLARQRAQVITAPRDGTVLRIPGNSEGQILKQGDPLLTLVPSTDQRAVELWVDGNDAPLITPGRSVRLQFEGWPAVQFVGWPEVAIGTFGGIVAFVDATDNGEGKFRIMILPDPDQVEWPSDRFLRQGVRTKGWVLLNQVSLAYEIWRQLNGFPPVVAMEARQQDLARKRLK